MKFFYNLLIALLVGQSAFSQSLTVKGKIISREDNQPVIGATVVVMGTNKGAVSDVNGNYAILLNAGEDTLKCSYIGYKTQVIAVINRTEINITLELDAQMLSEVVAVGYGTQRKSDVTGAVSTVRGDDITKITAANPVLALQGKVAGLQVAGVSGQPGAAAVVRIRGVGTLNDASPIYVVDGVILDDINFLNSADIESFEVLKDASSTAIYGSRGANGVILVTTKSGKGKTDGKSEITVSAEYSLQHLAKRIDMLTGKQFAEVVNAISPGSYNNLDAVPNTNWQDQVFNEYAPMSNFHIALGGNTGKYNYYFGAGFFNQDGIVPESNYKRATINLNNTYAFSDHIKIGVNLTATPSENQNPPNVIATLYRAWPVSVPFNADGSFAEVGGSGNPLADIAYTNNTTSRLRTVGAAYLELKLLKDFTFLSSYGFDLAYAKDESFTPAFYVSPSQSAALNSLTLKNSQDKMWLFENTLTYSKTFGKQTISILGGITAQENTASHLGGSVKDLISDDPSMWYLSAGDQNTLTTDNPGDVIARLSSYLFRVNYNYDNRYLFTGSIRRDGSSKFGPNDRYGNFPSAAVGWNIINEKFMADSKLTNLKLRGSWGIIGNEKIEGTKQYSLVTNNINPVFGTSELLYSGSSYGVTGNENLKWEQTSQTDIGIETGFLKNRLKVELDYYRKVTDGILVNLIVPGHLGNGAFATITYNAAEVLNSGFELTLSWTDKIGEMNYTVGVIGSSLHNEVLQLGATTGVNSYIVSGSLGNGQQVSRTEVGHAVGEFYGYNVIGVIQNSAELLSSPTLSGQQVGDLKYEDINNDGIIDTDDRTYLGSYIPKFIYGFNLNLNYKNFDLSMDFSGQFGNKIYNGKAAVRPDLYNYEANVAGFWQGDGSTNSEPRPTSGGINYEPSSYFIQDGSFFRMRSLTLNYNFTSGLTKKLKLGGASVYLRATNLFTISDYTGYTPEIASEDALSSGIDLGVYPVTAIYSIGLNFNF